MVVSILLFFDSLSHSSERSSTPHLRTCCQPHNIGPPEAGFIAVRQRLDSTTLSLVEAISPCLLKFQEFGFSGFGCLSTLAFAVFTSISQNGQRQIHPVDVSAREVFVCPPKHLCEVQHVAAGNAPIPARGWAIAVRSWLPFQQGRLTLFHLHDPIDLAIVEIVCPPFLQGSVVQPMPRLRLSCIPIKTYLFCFLLPPEAGPDMH